MKKIIILLIICSSISCETNSQENKISIKGNWFTFDKPTKDESGETFINYMELYIDEKKVYHCTELMGIISPMDYHISNDSLFVYNVKANPESFVGIIDTITKNHFDVRAGDISKIYYKMSEDKPLENYIVQEKISRVDYYKAFRKRLNEQLGKVTE